MGNSNCRRRGVLIVADHTSVVLPNGTPLATAVGGDARKVNTQSDK